MDITEDYIRNHPKLFSRKEQGNKSFLRFMRSFYGASWRSISLLLGATAAGCLGLSQLLPTQRDIRNELVVLVSGKRFAGKDYICKRIQRRFEDQGIRYKRFNHADQMKRIYCDATGADLDLMFTDRTYKEQHRSAMTAMYQDIVSKESNQLMFCESILDQIVNDDISSDVILIGDFRRTFEQEFYERYFGGKDQIITIRVNATEETRKGRGWICSDSKDSNVTECELDNKADWGFVFENDGTERDAIQWIDDQLKPQIDRHLARLNAS